MICTPIQVDVSPTNQDVWDQYEDCEYFEDWNLTDDKYADEPPYYVHLGMPMMDINKRTLEDGAQIYLKQVIHSGFFTAWVQRANEKGVVEWLFPLEWDAAMIIFPDLEGKFSKYAMVDPFYGY
jgi:hypothetical protein